MLASLPFQDQLGLEGWFVLLLLSTTIFFLIKEIFPPDITLLIAGTIPLLMGIITKEQYLLSFANETILTIGMLFVIARAFEKTGVLFFLSKKILKEKQSLKKDLAYLLYPLAALSAFINNTPIVIMITPFIRRWAILQEKSPSKYLIPISFATILGGMCTLIGTSTNLVISFYLESLYPGSGFSFFEIGKVGIFCAFFGILFLIFFSSYLLPKRVDPNVVINTQMKEVLGEFQLKKSPLAYLSIKELSQKYLSDGITIIAIERGGQTISSPSPDFVLLPRDRLIFCGDHKELENLSNLKGIDSVSDPHFHMEKTSSHYTESVIPSDSVLIGRTLRSSHFRERFGGSVFALFREGKPLFSHVADIPLKAGDVLVILSSKPRDQDYTPRTKDLFLIHKSQEIFFFGKKKIFFVLGVIGAMIAFAASGISMMYCAIAASVILILTKVVSPREVVKKINWNLLILIAGGLSLAKAIEVTNVASLFAEYILFFAQGHIYLLIFSLFLLSVLITELVTNVASALIILPIALKVATLSQLDSLHFLKALGVTIAIGASCSFVTPIGYQTNTIIYGPGGYKFTDYFRVGIFLILIVGCLVTYFVPYFWQIE